MGSTPYLPARSNSGAGVPASHAAAALALSAAASVDLGGGAATNGWCAALAEHAPGVRHLDFADGPRISGVGLLAVAGHCRQLVSLNLNGVAAVTDAVASSLARNCSHLLALMIQGSAVSATGVATIVESLPQLRAVAVSGPAATDAALALVGRLRELVDLDVCSSVATDYGLMAVTMRAGVAWGPGWIRGRRNDSGCRKLTTVSLAGCPRITGIGLEHLAASCPSLATVSLGSVAGAVRLVQAAPALAHLVVTPQLPWHPFQAAVALDQFDVLCKLLADRPAIDALLGPVAVTNEEEAALVSAGFRRITRDKAAMPNGRGTVTSWRYGVPEPSLPYQGDNRGFCRVQTPVAADHPWRKQLPALVADD